VLEFKRFSLGLAFYLREKGIAQLLIGTADLPLEGKKGRKVRSGVQVFRSRVLPSSSYSKSKKSILH